MGKKEIAPENYFMLNSGGVIKNVKELALGLEYMSDEDFSHHVNEGKNDFSSWIADVFGDRKLAGKVAGAKKKEELQLALLKHLVEKHA